MVFKLSHSTFDFWFNFFFQVFNKLYLRLVRYFCKNIYKKIPNHFKWEDSVTSSKISQLLWISLFTIFSSI